MSEIPDRALLQELQFQLTVTRALLGSLDLDQMLFVILSGITHGDGLNFNRAVLLLATERANVLRASNATGPASRAEAHRIWEAMEASGLDLPTLIAQYDQGAPPEAATLARQLADLAVPLDAPLAPIDPAAASVPLSDLVADVVARRAPFVSNTLAATWTSGGAPALAFHPLAVVPIVVRESVLGVIVVDNAYNDRLIADDEVRGLTTLANLAGIAIEKGRLHEQVREMAARDGLTGVFNRRHYEERLQVECLRAARVGRPLGLLVIDIDGFKAVNDHHGHEVGDDVLRDLAGVFRAVLRREDVIARFGGEEFVALLTGGPAEADARRVAEKLRLAVRRAALGGLAAGAVTVSIGVASTGQVGCDPRALFRVADQALYRAKDRGRDRVVTASEA